MILGHSFIYLLTFFGSCMYSIPTDTDTIWCSRKHKRVIVTQLERATNSTVASSQQKKQPNCSRPEWSPGNLSSRMHVLVNKGGRWCNWRSGWRRLRCNWAAEAGDSGPAERLNASLPSITSSGGDPGSVPTKEQHSTSTMEMERERKAPLWHLKRKKCRSICWWRVNGWKHHDGYLFFLFALKAWAERKICNERNWWFKA